MRLHAPECALVQTGTGPTGRCDCNPYPLPDLRLVPPRNAADFVNEIFTAVDQATRRTDQERADAAVFEALTGGKAAPLVLHPAIAADAEAAGLVRRGEYVLTRSLPSTAEILVAVKHDPGCGAYRGGECRCSQAHVGRSL